MDMSKTNILLAFLWLPYIFVVASESRYDVSYKEILQYTCESLLDPTYFIPDKLICLKGNQGLSYDWFDPVGCINRLVPLPFKEPRKYTVTRELYAKAARAGLGKGDYDFAFYELCYLEQGECNKGFEMVGDKCFLLEPNAKTYQEGYNSCINRQASAVVFHRDSDIQLALKYMLRFAPQETMVWTGLYNHGSTWKMPPGHKIDYARWSPLSNFTYKPLDGPVAAVMQSKHNKALGSYVGYMLPRNQYEKYRTLCYTPVKGFAYQNFVIPTPIVTPVTTTVKPSTGVPVTTTRGTTRTTLTTKKTTTAPTTTAKPRPQEEVWEEIVNEKILGRLHMDNVLRRTYYPALIFHQYHLDFNKHCSNVYTKEKFVGFVVTKQMWGGIKSSCPNLVLMNIYQSKSTQKWSYIDTTEKLANTELVGSFYCAPRKGYCGANYELREYLSKVGGGDKLYPSNSEEVRSIPNNTFYHDNVNRRLCWIWKDTPSNISAAFNQARKVVLNENNQFLRSVSTYIQTTNSYSINEADHRSILSYDKKRENKIPIGYFVTNNMWKNDFQTRCPKLKVFNLWRKQGSPITTWFGPNSPFAATALGPFYCAPYRGYCGADYLLANRPSVVVGADNFASPTYEEDENVKCTRPRYSKTNYPVCWMWKHPDFYVY